MVSHKPIIIIGAGGHAKVLADAIQLSGREILGFVTPDMIAGTKFCGKKILGNDSVITNYAPDKIELANGLGSLPGKSIRWQLSYEMQNMGYTLASIVHPSAVISATVRLVEGTQIMAGAVVQSGTIIGLNSIINTGVCLDHDCSVGANCHLATGVTCSGGVRIGDNCHIGSGAMLTEYISIGQNCTIAAGSIVYKNVADNMKLIQKRVENLSEQTEEY